MHLRIAFFASILILVHSPIRLFSISIINLVIKPLIATTKNKAIKVVYSDPTAAAWRDVADEEEDLYMQDNIFEPILEDAEEVPKEDEELLEDLANTLQAAEQQLEAEEHEDLLGVYMNHSR